MKEVIAQQEVLERVIKERYKKLSENFKKPILHLRDWLGKVLKRRKERKNSPNITIVYGGFPNALKGR